MKGSPRGFVGKIGDSDIRLLRVFCTVVRCGGFAAAESELQLSLPSISRYIKDLEIRLCVRLCRRGRVGFSLTEHGKQVYAASLQLLANLERFEALVGSIHGELTGTLTLGIIDTLLTDENLRLPELLRRFKHDHPQVRFDVQTKTTNVIEQSVIDGTLDAGIVIGRRHISQLEYRSLYKERNNLYCAQGHPLFDRDLERLGLDDIVSYEYVGYAFVDEADRGHPIGRLVKSAIVDSMEALATLVSSGCFLGILPEHYVRSVSRLSGLKAVLPALFSSSAEIALITRPDAASPLVGALLDYMDEQLSNAAWVGGRAPAGSREVRLNDVWLGTA
jgi:DNA-binding transcriptional LysR family regulator